MTAVLVNFRQCFTVNTTEQKEYRPGRHRCKENSNQRSCSNSIAVPLAHLARFPTSPLQHRTFPETMFDTICTLPLTSDLFAQAIHPKSSIIAVGLASGHVQTYVLPNIDSSPNTPPQNGCGTIDTAWRTKRHKGSCRSLTFSSDGETLYSAGTDGIVKAARTETGVVEAKIAVPLSKYPLPPQCPHVPARIYEMDGLMKANHNPRQLPP